MQNQDPKRNRLQKLFDFFNFRKKRKVERYDLYDKCNILPIHNFNEVMNGDLSFLQKDRNVKVPEDVLQEVWINVLDEYLKISKSAITISMLGKKVKSVYLISQLDVFTALQKCIDYGTDVSELLKKYKVKPETLNQKISLVKNEINLLFSKEQNREETSSENSNFEMSLVMIRKEGYTVDRFKMVVTEWCAILNQIEKQHK